VVANQMVRKIPLKLAGRVFPTTLVILEGQGINAILGMNWMKMHRAVLDISAHLVRLDSPIYGKVLCSCHLSLVSRHPSMPLLPRAWMRYLWSMNIWVCFLMIYHECLLIGPLNLRLSCSLVLPLSISGHILWREMRWQN
jgi:hypothetical protein